MFILLLMLLGCPSVEVYISVKVCKNVIEIPTVLFLVSIQWPCLYVLVFTTQRLRRKYRSFCKENTLDLTIAKCGTIRH